MTANEALVRLLEQQQESFLKTVRKVPSDKLDWAPGTGTRSALDQFQEVATITGDHWELYSDRKLDWTEEGWASYMERRKSLATLDSLEARLREDTARLTEFVRALPADQLMEPTQMPFPGDHRVLDNIYYHIWNMAYHEGQVAAILQQLGVDPMG